MNKIKKRTLQEWMPIEKIYFNGIIKTKDNNYLKILKVMPINYNLKSELEKESILNSYKILLKTCNFNIQILVQSNKEDLSNHIKKIKKHISKKENKYLKEISENYINYINQVNLKSKSSLKNFFIIISVNNKLNQKKSEEIINNELKEKYFKIKECLSRCGNSVTEINNRKEVEKIFFSIFNIKKYNKIKFFYNK